MYVSASVCSVCLSMCVHVRVCVCECVPVSVCTLQISQAWIQDPGTGLWDKLVGIWDVILPPLGKAGNLGRDSGTHHTPSSSVEESCLAWGVHRALSLFLLCVLWGLGGGREGVPSAKTPQEAPELPVACHLL